MIISVAFLQYVAISFLMTQVPGEETRLACLSLNSADSDFTVEFYHGMKEKLEALGYDVRTSYCDNDPNTQLNQLQNYLLQKPAVLVIDSVGNDVRCDELLERMPSPETSVIVLNASTELQNAQIQLLSSGLSRGLCAYCLVSNFINGIESDDTEKIKVLLLGDSETEKDIRILAGYQLMAEKYLRYYDKGKLDFIRTEGAPVYYDNGNGKLVQVDEPSGGLYLDENGYAVLNPYYDARIELCFPTNCRNISTNLQGQQAVDAFLSETDNHDLQIILCTNGDAAAGAAKRFEGCFAEGKLAHSHDELAVFGADNTEQAQDQIIDSMNGKGLYRGFVGDFNISMETDNILRLLTVGKKATYREYGFYSGYRRNPEKVGITVLYDGGVSSLDLFGE